MTQTTRTILWNDSCSIQELSNSIESNGATGATCNPVIVLSVLKQEWNEWKDRIPQIISEMPAATEEQLGWKLIEEVSQKAAALLLPAYKKSNGKNGRLSIQTNPKFYRNAQAIIQQAKYFSELAPNMIVKIPVTAAGIDAIEEATYLGVSINATVCFTLPQVIAVAQAVERGLARREHEKKDISHMGPICTLMVGRLDDWLRVISEKEAIIANPWIFDWAGVAVFKKAYQIFKERGYRIRLLSAAFRNHLHWSEFVGGEVVISPPYPWQVKLNASGISIRNRIDDPVNPEIIHELFTKFADFRLAFEENGMDIAAFDQYGATRRTLRQFCEATDRMSGLIRDFMVPNPDT